MIEQLIDKGLNLQENITVEEVQHYLKELEMVDKGRHLEDDLEEFIRSKSSYKIIDGALLLVTFYQIVVNACSASHHIYAYIAT